MGSKADTIFFWSFSFSFCVAARFLVWFAALRDVKVELVLLVATKVSVGHEVQGVTVSAGPWSDEVQNELGLLLQGQTLNGEKGVGLRITDHDPPAFFAFRGEERGDDGSGDLVFSLQFDFDVDGRAALQVVLVNDRVLQLDVRVTVAEPGNVGHLEMKWTM